MSGNKRAKSRHDRITERYCNPGEVLSYVGRSHHSLFYSCYDTVLRKATNGRGVADSPVLVEVGIEFDGLKRRDQATMQMQTESINRDFF